MKIRIALVLPALASIAFATSTPVQMSEIEPTQSTRCWRIQPLCRPGTHPICICESEYSLNCNWICASQ